MAEFSQKEYLRYSRHIQLPGVGIDGQLKLKSARVLIVGCGGLGAPVSLYLAAAGLGNITLIDGDSVELSNLQRQITFSEKDIGKNKALCTQQRLQQLNSDIQIDAIDQALSVDNAEALIQSADLVLDCTDNFPTRYLINDLCKINNTPWIYASVYQQSGQCALFTPQESCFRCLFPSPPKGELDCNAAGVLGVLPGLLGTLQATEALKYLADIPCSSVNTLLLVETSDMHFQKITLQKDSNCILCSDDNPVFDPSNNDYKLHCSAAEKSISSISAVDFEKWSQRDDIVLIDIREQHERDAFNLGGEHIPADQLLSSIAGKVENKTALLYCQSGVRSQKACELLLEKNIKALSVAGGIKEIIRQ